MEIKNEEKKNDKESNERSQDFIADKQRQVYGDYTGETEIYLK